jgi:23S rRNA (cytosine1962-C5)-methyltransferase
MIELLSPTQWEDYELIDCGNFEKLERFGKYITIRPEPQAIWDPAMPMKEWEKLAHVKFKSKSSSTGEWIKLKNPVADRWHIKYQTKDISIQFRLAFTSFKHVGIFPEQAANWDYAAKAIKAMKIKEPKVLNLFAYTGGASIAARSAGAEVTHVDSIKQVVTWANENQELSNLKDIKWVVEDALKFVKREVKRGKKYNGIILDPPAFGHGPNGEKWKLEDSINEIMKDVAQLADPDNFFLILNTYSLGFSSLIVENLIKSSFRRTDNLSIGELYLQASKGAKLPLGVYGKIQYIK